MKILVIDDEKNVRRIVGDYLKNEGYEVIEGKDGEDGIEQLIKHKDIGLILLDIRMPKMDGFETLKEIRLIADAPVIFLTALDESFDEVRGLELGADDYITKPFNYSVLMARVKSCIRKNQKNTSEVMTYRNMSIDFTNREVRIGGTDKGLTLKEFELLEYLIKNKSMTMERGKILDRLWGYDYYGDPRTVDTHVKTLRAKLEQYNQIIKTVRGVGYKLELDKDENDPQ